MGPWNGEGLKIKTQQRSSNKAREQFYSYCLLFWSDGTRINLSHRVMFSNFIDSKQVTDGEDQPVVSYGDLCF